MKILYFTHIDVIYIIYRVSHNICQPTSEMDLALKNNYNTYKNSAEIVLNSSYVLRDTLLCMYIHYVCMCVYFYLFIYLFVGKLMRAFPLEDKDNIVQEISEQLCDLIQSGQGDISILHQNLVFLYNNICV